MARLEPYIITAIAVAAGVAVTIMQWLHPDTRKWLLRIALSFCIAVVFVGVRCIVEIEGGHVIGNKQIGPIILMILCVIGLVLGLYWFASEKESITPPKPAPPPDAQAQQKQGQQNPLVKEPKQSKVPPTFRENIEADKPYFVLSRVQIVKTTPEQIQVASGYDHIMQTYVANEGKHTATDIRYRRILVDTQFQTKPQIEDSSRGNDFPNGYGNLHQSGIDLKPVSISWYFIFAIKYKDKDTSSQKALSQIWFFKQLGGEKREFPIHFFETSASERKDIMDHLKEELKNYGVAPASKQEDSLSFLLADCTFDGYFKVRGNFEAFRKAFPESGSATVVIDIYPKDMPEEDISITLSGEWHGTSGMMHTYPDDSIVFSASEKTFLFFRKKPIIIQATKGMTQLLSTREYAIELMGIPGFGVDLFPEALSIRNREGLLFTISNFTLSKEHRGKYYATFRLG